MIAWEFHRVHAYRWLSGDITEGADAIPGLIKNNPTL
jgi:hypothetical protein